jgi:hypothetical protein
MTVMASSAWNALKDRPAIVKASSHVKANVLPSWSLGALVSLYSLVNMTHLLEQIHADATISWGMLNAVLVSP